MASSKLYSKLFGKIIVIFFIVSITIFCVTSAFFFFKLRTEYLSKGKAISKAIADSATTFLVTEDLAVIQEHINHYNNYEGIDYVFLTDSNQDIISHTFSPVPPDYIHDHLSLSEPTFQRIDNSLMILIRSDILYGSLGNVYIMSDLAPIIKQILYVILFISVAIFIIVTLGMLYLSRYFHKLIDPVQILGTITQKISLVDFKLTKSDEMSLQKLQTIDDEIGQFSGDFYTLCQRLEHYFEDLQIATKSQAEIEKELDIAKTIQLNLLGTPPTPTITENINISVFLEPAKIVGGDFYDIYDTEDYIFVTIGDVSGKGIGASLFMTRTITTIRSLIQMQSDPIDIMTEVNAQLCLRNDNMLFVTVFFAVIDKKDYSMNYVNAGHPSPFLIKQDKTITEIPTTGGVVMGVDPHAFYDSQQTVLSPNSFLMLYTDGLNEAHNKHNDILGLAQVKEWASKPYSSATDFKESIVNHWNEFCGDHDKVDDFTLVIIQNSAQPTTSVPNPLPVHFTNDVQELVKLQHVVELFCQTYQLNKKIQQSVNLVLEELITNTIFYGYADHSEHTIYVTLHKHESTVQIIVEDDATPFNPLKDAPETDSSLDIQEKPIGGLGINIVKNMMNDIEYKRTNNKNILTLTKEIT
ncbi:hypothetical protein DID76_04555 [Candidatus Marinamargulisbacteria bacterium SCGC AG-414-C22]|nr:hypothetical protein DID76_04555 [Candidatus Marinamargulisbacteria bacterium SCGC AG-414-C22]